MNKIVLICLFFLFNVVQNDPVTIVFYGDSLTAGYGLDPQQAFPALVEEQLKEAGHEVEVINAGVSGETSAGGLTRVDWTLNRPVDVFILELGANDGLRGLPLESTRNNLQQIIDKVKGKNPGVKIILAGMMVPPNMGPDYGEQFRTMYVELARKNEAALIPFLLEDVAGIEDLNLPDGIHPNVEGHKIVASNVLEVLQPLL